MHDDIIVLEGLRETSSAYRASAGAGCSGSIADSRESRPSPTFQMHTVLLQVTRSELASGRLLFNAAVRAGLLICIITVLDLIINLSTIIYKRIRGSDSHVPPLATGPNSNF